MDLKKKRKKTQIDSDCLEEKKFLQSEKSHCESTKKKPCN